MKALKFHFPLSLDSTKTLKESFFENYEQVEYHLLNELSDKYNASYDCQWRDDDIIIHAFLMSIQYETNESEKAVKAQNKISQLLECFSQLKSYIDIHLEGKEHLDIRYYITQDELNKKTFKELDNDLKIISKCIDLVKNIDIKDI